MAGWRWATASCRGVSHERTGTRLQDAIACIAPQNPLNPLIAIVSDGAGSASHGGQGASLVCRSVTQSARKHFQRCQALPSDAEIEAWVDTTRDLISAVAARRGLVPRDFAATLVCVISDSHESIVVHVGDGCAVLKDEMLSKWVAPSWPDHGEYASTTFFVTDEEVLKLRISRHIGEVSSIAVFSDGLERLALEFSINQPFERFFDTLISPVFASSAIGKDKELSRKLNTYLGSPAINARTDDDKSLILAVRR